MKKLSTGEIISIVSILVSILMVALQSETDKAIQIGIIAVFGIAVLAYFIYSFVQRMKLKQGMSSAAIISKAKKYTNQLLKLVKANEKQLKKFNIFSAQKKIEKYEKKIVKKCAGDIIDLKKSPKALKLKAEMENHIKEASKKSENYCNLESLKAYNAIYKIMPETSLIKTYKVTLLLIKRIFEMNRILLQLEQHTTRIKLGEFVARYTNNPEERIKAYMDLIGWSYILLGQNKKGFTAIFNAISLIEGIIGTDGNIPEGVDKKTYYSLLFLKIRAYRHLGSTYYTHKDIDAMMYCQKAIELLNEDFKKGLNDDVAFENMICGVKNNLYLAELYEFIKETNKNGRPDLEKLNNTLANINNDLAELYKLDDQQRDKHRVIKLLSLKSQVNKVLIISNGSVHGSLDVKETSTDLKVVESVLNKNIYFDDAMEVYANQKVQLIFEEAKNIMLDIDE